CPSGVRIMAMSARTPSSPTVLSAQGSNRFQSARAERPNPFRIIAGVARRSYGPGRLYVVVDLGARARWYRSWWVGTTRVKRKIGLKRTLGNADA
ncbi:MAG: hypothetical protein QOC78_1034, partial [Solirubrobacteraceae bacterium]|nr:hypothetical protein [Solirubrobacteraceae bacterium]